MKAGTLTETLVMQSGLVGIGVNTPGAPLHIEAADNANLLRFTVSGQEDWAFKGASAVGSNDTISFGIFNGTQAMAWDEAGRCTKPNQPAFQVHKNGTDQDNFAHASNQTVRKDSQVSFSGYPKAVWPVWRQTARLEKLHSFNLAASGRSATSAVW